MQTAILRHMEQKNEQPEKEARYRAANDDIRLVRNELNKLSLSMGEMLVAIKGNDLGTTGLVGQIKEFKQRLDAFEERLDGAEQSARDAQLQADKKQFYLIIIWGVIGSAAGVIFASIIYHFFPKSK